MLILTECSSCFINGKLIMFSGFSPKSSPVDIKPVTGLSSSSSPPLNIYSSSEVIKSY